MLWLVPLLPLIGFVFNALLGDRLGRPIAGALANAMLCASFAVSLFLFIVLLSGDGSAVRVSYIWLSIEYLHIEIALLLDRLSGIMVVMITGVASLIHLYSVGYMAAEPKGYARYFAYLNLFVFFMLLLILADNLALLFIGWEGVGLCSFLLIGYYVDKQAAAAAAKKAFVMNRIGDFGLMGAILIFYHHTGGLTFEAIIEGVRSGAIGGDVLTWSTLLLFLGCAGKSAQIPLYTWLPDAMEGPTPVSALIHAATMVTSGVYLIARLGDVFLAAETTLQVIAWAGSATALIAALIALVQDDIKKVLAYSTISQLGYMFMALGVGAFSTGLFHLLTHAFFKALLFLSAGAVIHLCHHQQNIKEYRGLPRRHPFVQFIFGVGVWAIAGLPLAAGFFSKDEIIWKLASSTRPESLPMTIIALIVAFLTAAYMYRLYYLVFSRGNAKGAENTMHSLPQTMRWPLVVLALFSVISGYWGVPHVIDFFGAGHMLDAYFAGVLPHIADNFIVNDPLEIVLIIMTLAMTLFGWLVARSRYAGLSIQIQKNKSTNPILLVPKKLFFIDAFYTSVVGKGFFLLSELIVARILHSLSLSVPHFLSYFFLQLGKRYSHKQTGLVRHYLLITVVSALLFYYFTV